MPNYIDVRVEFDKGTTFTEGILSRVLQDWSGGNSNFKVTPLPAVASEEEIARIIYKFCGESIVIQGAKGIINVMDLAQALSGKVGKPVEVIDKTKAVGCTECDKEDKICIVGECSFKSKPSQEKVEIDPLQVGNIIYEHSFSDEDKFEKIMDIIREMQGEIRYLRSKE